MDAMVGIAGVVVPVLPGSVLVVGAILLWAARTGTTTGWVVFSVATALVVVGAADRLTPPAEAHAMAKRLPGAELVVLPDAGHMLMFERRDVIEKLLQRFALDTAERQVDRR